MLFGVHSIWQFIVSFRMRSGVLLNHDNYNLSCFLKLQIAVISYQVFVGYCNSDKPQGCESKFCHISLLLVSNVFMFWDLLPTPPCPPKKRPPKRSQLSKFKYFRCGKSIEIMILNLKASKDSPRNDHTQKQILKTACIIVSHAVENMFHLLSRPKLLLSDGWESIINSHALLVS